MIDFETVRHIFQHHVELEDDEFREAFKGLLELTDEEVEEFEQFGWAVCDHLLDKLRRKNHA